MKSSMFGMNLAETTAVMASEADSVMSGSVGELEGTGVKTFIDGNIKAALCGCKICNWYLWIQNSG